MRLRFRILIILLLAFLFISPGLSVSAVAAQGSDITPVAGEWKSDEVSYETTWGQTYRLSIAVTVSEDGTELSYITLFLNHLLGMISVGTFNRSTPIESGTFTVDIEAGVVDREGDPVKLNVNGSFVDPMTLEATVTLSVADAPVNLTAQPTDAQSVIAPKPGRWQGDYEASFEVGEDGLIRDFQMVVPFEGGGRTADCTLRADDNPAFEVMADGAVSFSDVKVKDSELSELFFRMAQWAGIDLPTTTNEAGETLVTVENVEGRFTSTEEITGTFSVFICGGAFIMPASQGEWSARWVSGGPTAAAGEPVTLTAQPTEVAETATAEPMVAGGGPRPGRWQGDYEATFEVGEDGLIRDFEITVPFGQSGHCVLHSDNNAEIAVEANGLVSFSDVKVMLSEIDDPFFAMVLPQVAGVLTTKNEAGDVLYILEDVEGQFTDAEAFMGKFIVLRCGSELAGPPSQGEWSARWVSGGPTAAAGEPVPQSGKWQTGDTPLGQGSAVFRLGMSVELDTAGDWDFSLINTLFISVDGTRVAGTWFPERNPDGTFSAVREFPELGNATVTIEGRFVSPTEARGTLTYNDLPPVEWTAGTVEE